MDQSVVGTRRLPGDSRYRSQPISLVAGRVRQAPGAPGRRRRSPPVQADCQQACGCRWRQACRQASAAVGDEQLNRLPAGRSRQAATEADPAGRLCGAHGFASQSSGIAPGRSLSRASARGDPWYRSHWQPDRPAGLRAPGRRCQHVRSRASRCSRRETRAAVTSAAICPQRLPARRDWPGRGSRSRSRIDEITWRRAPIDRLRRTPPLPPGDGPTGSKFRMASGEGFPPTLRYDRLGHRGHGLPRAGATGRGFPPGHMEPERAAGHAGCPTRRRPER